MATFGPMFGTGNAIIMLGTNLGDRIMNLDRARRSIAERIGQLDSISSIYTTEPWGFTGDAPDFLNQALSVSTSMVPVDVMKTLLAIEQLMGRNRSIETTSRIIDLDLILMDDHIVESEILTLPHPRFHLRRFNLLPINEIRPETKHPIIGKTIGQLLISCQDSSLAVPFGS